MRNIFKHLTESQFWKSIFRHSYEDTPRNRALQILSNVFLHLHPVRVSRLGVKIKHTWCMGGITALLFIILTISGLLLMFYYRPAVEHAYHNMKDLEFTVRFGLLLRNIHRWGAHLMVIAVMLHMFRVFMTGSYKPPREFNWVIGVVLLVLTLLLSFTGYLLPWDQLGFWAITVGTNMASAAPVVGHEGPLAEQAGTTAYNDLRFALLGGSEVGSNALLRAYVWHCIGIPVIAIIFMVVHFWRVRKDGGISGPL
jgi:quinol-cytochrome oxidoreductase complex cytochrome b subunit